MRVTSKGQVTIPQAIRDKLGITPSTDVEFREEGERVYLVKKADSPSGNNRFRRFRGMATIKMSTDEIMALTRGT